MVVREEKRVYEWRSLARADEHFNSRVDPPP